MQRNLSTLDPINPENKTSGYKPGKISLFSLENQIPCEIVPENCDDYWNDNRKENDFFDPEMINNSFARAQDRLRIASINTPRLEVNGYLTNSAAININSSGELATPLNTPPLPYLEYVTDTNYFTNSVFSKKYEFSYSSVTTSSPTSTGLNVWEEIALTQLQEYGLTTEMLLNRNAGGHIFNESHCYALIKLVENDRDKIVEALNKIEDLSPAQADGIKHNLTRDDVVPLSNFWHIEALIPLKKYGLTAQMLLALNMRYHEFDDDHCYALIKLVQEYHKNIKEALNIIEGLSDTEAFRLQNSTPDNMYSQSTNNFFYSRTTGNSSGFISDSTNTPNHDLYSPSQSPR